MLGFAAQPTELVGIARPALLNKSVRINAHLQKPKNKRGEVHYLVKHILHIKHQPGTRTLFRKRIQTIFFTDRKR